MNEKKTYEDIARESGLSLATISRIFNKNPAVKASTRQKVIDAMEKLGIDTSQYDLEPKLNGNLILFNVPSLKNPFYSPIASSARLNAERHGFSLLVNEDPISEKTEDAFIKLLKKTKAAGLICANSVEKERLERLAAIVPTVTCCEAVEDSHVPFVSIDDEEAAWNAVNYIIGQGRKRIALINGPSDFKYASARFRGYRDALKKHGIEVDESIIGEVGPDMDYDTANALAIQMINSPNPPDAFFCISDVLAAAAIKACLTRGLRVPEDVMVVGFDNIYISKIMNPSITTVRQPTTQIGALAIEMVIKLMRKEAVVKSVYLGTELLIRESTQLQLRD